MSLLTFLNVSAQAVLPTWNTFDCSVKEIKIGLKGEIYPYLKDC